MEQILTTEILVTFNTGSAKVAVLNSADKFVVNGNLVLCNYICDERHQLILASENSVSLYGDPLTSN